ncbi:MAG: cardiolipin synthase [Sphaerochaetaceae bacterium]|nr:cardiolipin synthase [Sphaerochaetaceae bacterium]
MKKVLGRVIVVLPAIALQVLWYFLIIVLFDGLFQGYLPDILQLIFSVLAVIFVTSLIAKRDESSYKLLWVLVITALPVLGAFFYLAFGNKNTGSKLKKNLEDSAAEINVEIPSELQGKTDEIAEEDLRLAQTLNHVSSSTGFPVCRNGSSRYYPLGEDMFKDMCEDLKTASSYIYVEYFIIQSGKFWDTMVDIMVDRIAQGVDVRVMYDDIGSIGTYSAGDVKKLRDKGIKCVPFNPFFLLRSQLNNRDHRKIMVIDGRVAYSGGVNLADEYINAYVKYGHWKDIGFRITGEAVNSYTYMFSEFWNAFSGDKISTETVLSRFVDKQTEEDNGFILPYYDSPMREEHTSNELFTEILSMATEYVWFYTPYLILGDSLFDALIRAAKRGVDVRIIMPGIPDKKMVFRLSRSYYRDLILAGVKVYEYTPGFVHAKAFIADDKVAGIGTVNLDYRSLFLHFECNAVFYKADIIDDLKEDIINTQEKCREVTLEDTKKGLFYRFINNVLRVFAPLL